MKWSAEEVEALSIELVLDLKADLGEGPIWDDRTQLLYVLDINKAKIYIHDPKAELGSEESCSVVDLPQSAGCIVPTQDPNKFLAFLEDSVRMVDIAKKSTGGPIIELPEDAVRGPGIRFNDGKASPEGAALVGRMHVNWRDGHKGRWYRFSYTPSGKPEIEEVFTGDEVWLPNGLVWDPRQPGFVYTVDTGAGTITKYTTDSYGVPKRDSDGNLMGRVVVTVPIEEGVPDGLTVDQHGNLWVCLAEGGAVACYDSESGEQLVRLKTPVHRPTSLIFGGPDMKYLYITSRVEPGYKTEVASENWGGLFRVEIPGIHGVPFHVANVPALSEE